ncbi:hypothetical protein D3C87_1589530 [compost metagenome]
MNIVPKILYVNTGIAGFFLIRFSLIEAQPDGVAHQSKVRGGNGWNFGFVIPLHHGVLKRGTPEHLRPGLVRRARQYRVAPGSPPWVWRHISRRAGFRNGLRKHGGCLAQDERPSPYSRRRVRRASDPFHIQPHASSTPPDCRHQHSQPQGRSPIGPDCQHGPARRRVGHWREWCGEDDIPAPLTPLLWRHRPTDHAGHGPRQDGRPRAPGPQQRRGLRV